METLGFVSLRPPTKPIVFPAMLHLNSTTEVNCEKIICLTLADATNLPRFQGARPYHLLIKVQVFVSLGG